MPEGTEEPATVHWGPKQAQSTLSQGSEFSLVLKNPLPWYLAQLLQLCVSM